MKIVLDTNILIFTFIFGGKPRQILSLVLEGKIQAFISPILIAEFFDVVNKKFNLSDEELTLTRNHIENKFIIVQPKRDIKIARDDDDNRVLEAALEGKCSYIITGDKDLLDLKIYKNIKIVTPDIFLEEKTRGES